MNSNEKEQVCKCGHKKEVHNLDSFGIIVCDKVTEYPNEGTYDFECECREFREKNK